VAEYDDEETTTALAGITGTNTAGNAHNTHQRISSNAKFQWQNILGNNPSEINTGDDSFGIGMGGGAAGGGGADTTTGGGSSTRTSRCYSARTRTVRRSVNPIYNEEFRFEVPDDTLLQDEPLLFHVWDLTGASTTKGGGGRGQHGSIGLVYVDLNPLLTRTAIDAAGMDAEKSGSGSGGNEDQTEGRNERCGSFGASSGEFNVSGRDSMNAEKGGLSAGVIDGWFPLYDTLGGVRGELGLSS